MNWFVYVLVSEPLGVTYVGVTTEVGRRLAEHNGERAGGARSTRRGRPWRIGAVSGPIKTRSAAMRLEYDIKRSRGCDRIALAEAQE